MNLTIAQIVEFLKEDNFTKFTNVDDFPNLDDETKDILKNYGIPNKEWGCYPRITNDGKLKKVDDNLVEFSLNWVDDKYCIDKQTKKIMFINEDSKKISQVNSSLKKFLECKYTMAYYYSEIEFKEKYGNYWENRMKYVSILRDMLNEVEPGIENYPIWEEEIMEKELGVI